jgi:hypothetical protein
MVQYLIKGRETTLFCSKVIWMRISPVILGSFSYGPSLERGQRAGRGGDRRDILVPLINRVIVNQGGLDLDATYEFMGLVCTIVDIELDR